MSSKTKLVIIDDDKDFVDAIVERLKFFDFLAAGITNGTQFFQLISKFKPDIIIISSNLQNPEWPQLLNRIKSSSILEENTPIIILCPEISTGFAQQSKVHRIKKIVKKPVMFQEFLDVLGSLE